MLIVADTGTLIKASTMKSICRLCGQDKEMDDTSNIFQNQNYPELPAIIQRRIGIVVSPEDHLAQKMCAVCLEKVVSFDVFATRCSQVQSSFGNKATQQEFRLPISCVPLHRPLVAKKVPPKRNTSIEIITDAISKIVTPATKYTITRINNTKDASLKATPAPCANFRVLPTRISSTSPICGSNKTVEFRVPLTGNGNNNGKCSIELTPVVGIQTEGKKKNVKCGPIQIELSDEVEYNNVSSIPCNVLNNDNEGDEEALKSVEDKPKVPLHVPFNIRRAIPDVCPYCDEKMDVNSCLQKHIKEIHPGKELNYKCAVCNRNFQTKNGLDRHKDTHSELPRFCCELCGKLFKSHTSFCNHKKIHDPLSYRFTCTYNKCGRIFNNKSSYAEHARIHTGESPFPCDECESTFRTKGQLNNHKWIHADIRNYQCQLCGRKFRHNSHLKVHIKRHKGEKDLQCEICEKSFVNNYDLTRHKRTHTGERPFQCHLCSRALIDSGTYKKHMKMHEDYMAVLDDDDDDIDINMNPDDEDTLNEIQIRIDPLEDDSTMEISCSELLQIGTSALALKERKGDEVAPTESPPVNNDEAAVLKSIEQTVKSTLTGQCYGGIIQKDHNYVEILLEPPTSKQKSKICILTSKKTNA